MTLLCVRDETIIEAPWRLPFFALQWSVHTYNQISECQQNTLLMPTMTTEEIITSAISEMLGTTLV